MTSHHKILPLAMACLWTIILLTCTPAWSVDISGILPAAFEQPMINFYISTTANGAPLSNPDGDPDWGLPFFNVTAYFDTGASGILLSKETADYLNVLKSSAGGQPVIFEDIGVGGSEEFYVSQPVYIALAGIPGTDLDNKATYQTSYTHKFGPVQMQINKNEAGLFPFDVVGVPAMAGKVVVMHSPPLDSVWTYEGMQTYVYNPGTPFHPATPDTDPGIPTTSHHIRLSYASFDSFTKVTPTGAAGPTMAENPFIGPNPVAALYGGPADNTPGVTISYGGLKTTGSFLLDTGAAVSMISTSLAAELHIRYAGSGLELFDPARPDWSAPIPNQFTMELGGIGGTATAAGFYLDSMLLKTLEGNPNNDSDPNHLNFRGVPVLVNDITVQDPITLQTLTLDGVFGMNNLLVSMSPDMSDFASGNFNWIVFDQPNGILGLDVKAPAVSWNGSSSSTDPNWKNQDNWGGQAPTEGFTLKFGATTSFSTSNNNNFDPGTQFAGITFDGIAAFNLQGNRIALTGNVVNISTQTQTISLDMTLTGAQRTFVADSADIVVAGHIDGDQGLLKSGVKKLILKNSNTYTGETTISQGTLTLDGGDLSDASTVNILSSAMLEVVSGTPTLGDITGPGTVAVTGAGTVLSAHSIVVDTLLIGSTITSAYWTGGSDPADPYWKNPSNWVGTAPQPGDVLNFGQAGTLSVDNSNNFTANTQFSGIAFWGNSPFKLEGNRIALTGNIVNNSLQPQTIDLELELTGTSRTFNASTADILVSKPISGDQGLTKLGSEKLILTSSNTYTGPTTISEGTVILNGGDLADTSAISIAPNAALEIINGTPTLGTITGQGTIIVAGPGTILTTPSITADTLTITSAAPTAVPEPSTLVLLGACLTVLFLVPRLRQGTSCP
jgi:autotransporter-associated beta strand protein